MAAACINDKINIHKWLGIQIAGVGRCGDPLGELGRGLTSGAAAARRGICWLSSQNHEGMAIHTYHAVEGWASNQEDAGGFPGWLPELSAQCGAG